MSERLTPRQRARQATLEEIKRLAREQLSRTGSAGISLREIARELNIVSSAVYRYFPSRDELLTELIVEAYDALGDVAEAASAATAGEPPLVRWAAIARAIRRWALADPAEWALIYGSPVPGYQAPGERTIEPATRVPRVLLELLADIEAAGGSPVAASFPAPGGVVGADLEGVRAAIGRPIPDTLLLAGLAAWSFLFGAINLELFGHFTNVITDFDAYFEVQVERIASSLGLNVAAERPTN